MTNKWTNGPLNCQLFNWFGVWLYFLMTITSKHTHIPSWYTLNMCRHFFLQWNCLSFTRLLSIRMHLTTFPMDRHWFELAIGRFIFWICNDDFQRFIMVQLSQPYCWCWLRKWKSCVFDNWQPVFIFFLLFYHFNSLNIVGFNNKIIIIDTAKLFRNFNWYTVYRQYTVVSVAEARIWCMQKLHCNERWSRKSCWKQICISHKKNFLIFRLRCCHSLISWLVHWRRKKRENWISVSKFHNMRTKDRILKKNSQRSFVIHNSRICITGMNRRRNKY